MSLKPIRQGDFDGLCDLYSILNAVQWLLPQARDLDYLNQLFEKAITSIYSIKDVLDGSNAPQFSEVFHFIRLRIALKFRVHLELTTLKGSEKRFKSPDVAMQSKFDEGKGGVCLFGFEGLDNHWTVARGITTQEVILFDSWEYMTFDRRKFAWKDRNKSAGNSNKIIIAPTDLNWVSIGRRKEPKRASSRKS